MEQKELSKIIKRLDKLESGDEIDEDKSSIPHAGNAAIN